MNVEINTAADALLKAARTETSNRLCNFEVDGISSVSEIEEKVAEGQTIEYEDVDASEEISNVSEVENDSELDNERPQVSPNLAQAHLVLNLGLHIDNSHGNINESLHNPTVSQYLGENKTTSLLEHKIPNESFKSPKHLTSDDFEEKCLRSSETFEDHEDKAENAQSLIKVETRKRKRSIMDGAGSENTGGSISKHRGSPMSPEYQSVAQDRTNSIRKPDKLHDKTSTSEEIRAPNNVVDINKVEEPALELRASPCSPERLENKKKSSFNQGKSYHTKESGNVDCYEDTVNDLDTKKNDTPTPSNDDEEAETIVKNEEKRMEQLNREEIMLKQTQPSHPEYLAMLQCLDFRRNEKLQIAGKLRDFKLESLKKVAVAQRSQILVQFKQEVREVREKKIEQIGEQWYKIQHDRRNCASASPEFSLKFPTKKSQQVINHIAYSNEVSILAGIAKHVGFPAAPVMAPATASELEEDLEKMSASKQITQLAASLPFHDLAGLRAMSANSKFKPGEEQFVERTQWTNPHFPLHGHIVQRQVIAPQLPRTSSPLTQAYPRRHPHQHGVGPFPGIFSNPAIVQQSPGNIYPLHVPTPTPPIPSNNQN
ncbi:hypothetical protein BGHDH14_bgh01803 [Blumeria hordei DH14]|uniref:Transcriptional regulatory protein DEP1 n=1 Tax=Blumeria graminis f. sp. hordei (strain DH14) TaxID=546991 RepID=N1JLB1_BLUG1|nr:hypothetical protein BGHDH14_bgh01803 [Blumeria hordei DH14]